MNVCANVGDPMGCPKKRVPVVSSAAFGSVGESRCSACWRLERCCGCSRSRGDSWEVEVSIFCRKDAKNPG